MFFRGLLRIYGIDALASKKFKKGSGKGSAENSLILRF